MSDRIYQVSYLGLDFSLWEALELQIQFIKEAKEYLGSLSLLEWALVV